MSTNTNTNTSTNTDTIIRYIQTSKHIAYQFYIEALRNYNTNHPIISSLISLYNFETQRRSLGMPINYKIHLSLSTQNKNKAKPVNEITIMFGEAFDQPLNLKIPKQLKNIAIQTLYNIESKVTIQDMNSYTTNPNLIFVLLNNLEKGYIEPKLKVCNFLEKYYLENLNTYKRSVLSDPHREPIENYLDYSRGIVLIHLRNLGILENQGQIADYIANMVNLIKNQIWVNHGATVKNYEKYVNNYERIIQYLEEYQK